jgi:hypothetical protein
MTCYWNPASPNLLALIEAKDMPGPERHPLPKGSTKLTQACYRVVMSAKSQLPRRPQLRWNGWLPQRHDLAGTLIALRPVQYRIGGTYRASVRIYRTVVLPQIR